MISSIVILTINGDILLQRSFKDDVTHAEIRSYCSRVVAAKQYRQSPVRLLDEVSYIAVPCKKLIFLAVTRINVNCALAFQFLYHLITICKAFFRDEVTEIDIANNLSLIYEILDEAMDYGCPQVTDPVVLKHYIQEGKFQSRLKSITIGTGCGVLWGSGKLVYKKNEAFLTIVENVNAVFSSTGSVLSSHVTGKIQLNNRLSGVPQCQIEMNDKLSMDQSPAIELKFHKCVRHSTSDRERRIFFTPPDGQFELMSYRTSQNIKLPFKILTDFTECEGNRLFIRVKLKSLFEKKIVANSVVVKIPTHTTTMMVKASPLLGKAKYISQLEAIIWKISKFQGEFECFLDCEVISIEKSTEQLWVKPPIELKFEIPLFTASGVGINYFRVYEKCGYKTAKYFQSITKSENYKQRM